MRPPRRKGDGVLHLLQRVNRPVLTTVGFPPALPRYRKRGVALRIDQALVQATGPLTCTEIARQVNATGPTVRKHLKMMVLANSVTVTRNPQGLHVFRRTEQSGLLVDEDPTVLCGDLLDLGEQDSQEDEDV